MANKFTLKTFLDPNNIIYVAPILVVASFFHVFSRVEATQAFGKIEIFAALILVIYYLWDKIAEIYPHEKIWKKRIEAITCTIVSILFLFIPLAPLITWQYYNLYNASDRYSYKKQFITAILTVWIGITAMYSSFYIRWSEGIASNNESITQSSMPTTTYVAPGAAPVTERQ